MAFNRGAAKRGIDNRNTRSIRNANRGIARCHSTPGTAWAVGLMSDRLPACTIRVPACTIRVAIRRTNTGVEGCGRMRNDSTTCQQSLQRDRVCRDRCDNASSDPAVSHVSCAKAYAPRDLEI